MKNLNRHDLIRRQILVGKAKKLFDKGMNNIEVANELGISESTVRSIKATIYFTEKHK